MPNHIMNKVSFEGPKEKIEELRNACEGKESCFDFNKIVPMPEELNNYSCPVKIISEEEYQKQAQQLADGLNKHGIGMTDKISHELVKKYGYNNWYDWSLAFWGTKWNAYDVDCDDEDIVFQTAWSTPKRIIKALSLKFPQVSIKVEYADEDIGANCGIYEYKNGEQIKDWKPEESESAKWACELRGYDYEDYKKYNEEDEDEED